MIGFVVYATIDIDHFNVAHVACFTITWRTPALRVILDVRYNNEIANENNRVMLTSLSVPVANLMDVVNSNMFRPEDAPEYIPPLATSAASAGRGLTSTQLLGAWMTIDNRRRDIEVCRTIKARDIPTELLADGPANPSTDGSYSRAGAVHYPAYIMGLLILAQLSVVVQRLNIRLRAFLKSWKGLDRDTSIVR